MAYEPTNWKSGDVVTSAKLNKLEKGVEDAGGGLVVNVTYDETSMKSTADKTWQEIWDATCAGKSVVILYVDNSDPSYIHNFAYTPAYVEYEIDGGTTTYRVSYNNGATSLVCSDPDDYPVEVT